MTKIWNNIKGKKRTVVLRKFPHPYRAALSICSDCDDTKTRKDFLTLQKFFNTDEKTNIGRGLSLETGNSIFMFSDNDHFSYFSGNQQDRLTIVELIKSGHIDCLHSYGERKNFTREDAQLAIQELKKKNCFLRVWIDHRREGSNIGEHRTKGDGNNILSLCYHVDLTVAYGIRFVWVGALTPIIGQSSRHYLGFFSVFNPRFPIRSSRKLIREVIKRLLGILGYHKCRIYATNDLVCPRNLGNGLKVYEFKRFYNHQDGFHNVDNLKSLGIMLSKKTLQKLKDSEGYMILYTHFGKNFDCSQLIPQQTQKSLRNLASEYKNGNIYVTTTSKLLNYYTVNKYLNWSYEIDKNKIIIIIKDVQDPVFRSYIPSIDDLQGITFYIPDTKQAKIFIGDEEIKNIKTNPVDHTGQASVSIPLKPLIFPKFFF